MSMPYRLLAATLFLIVSATAVRAEKPAPTPAADADLKLLLQTIRSNRRALVAVNLQLNDQEAAAFWPLYDRYRTELDAVGDRIVGVVTDYVDHYTDLSNERALQLITDYIGAEADRLQVRKNYLPEFAKILPGLTVARFYQIENKMDAILRYDLAATIPVVPPAAAGAATAPAAPQRSEHATLPRRGIPPKSAPQ